MEGDKDSMHSDDKDHPLGDNIQVGTNLESGLLYQMGDELLEEVIFAEGDEPPDDDDTSTVWTDASGADEEVVEMDEGDIGADGQIPVVDMATCTFSAHSDCVYCSAIHPTSSIAITGGGDDKAYIWNFDVSTKSITNPVYELSGHTDTVTSVGFNYDGTLALSGSYDGTVRIWDVVTGQLKIVLEGPEDIEWAEWHSKGNAVVAGSRDGTIWMWLAHNGQCIQVFAGHDGGVTCGCFSSDGKVICSGGEDGTVRIWGPKTGQCKHSFDLGNGATVTCVASCDSDGDLLLVGSIDGTMKLLQISGKKILQTFIHSEPKPLDSATHDDEDEEAALAVECIGFSSKELRWVASGGMDNTLKVWDTTSGSCRCICSHGGSVVSLKWHKVLPIIYTASLDAVIRVWDARAGNLLLNLTGHNEIVTSLELRCGINSMADESVDSPQRPTDMIVSVSDDFTARVFTFDSFAMLNGLERI